MNLIHWALVATMLSEPSEAPAKASKRPAEADPKQKGQSLVEFALVIVFYMLIITGIVDIAPLLGNLYVAQQMAHRGARAASIYLADGTHSCYQDAVNAIGNPILMSATWTSDISANCDSNVLDTHAPGEIVSVRIVVDYTPLFWGGFGWPPRDSASVWSFRVEAFDQSR